MITKENFNELLQTIELDDINNAINGSGNYIHFQSHTFHTGSYGTIESCDYDEDKAEEVAACGDLFCDKDDFLRLCDELQSFEF